jgi:hypothetical protein
MDYPDVGVKWNITPSQQLKDARIKQLPLKDI